MLTVLVLWTPFSLKLCSSLWWLNAKQTSSLRSAITIPFFSPLAEISFNLKWDLFLVAIIARFYRLFSGIQMTRVFDVDGERQNTSLPSPSSLVCCLGLQYSRVFLCFMQMGSIPRVVLWERGLSAWRRYYYRYYMPTNSRACHLPSKFMYRFGPARDHGWHLAE